MDSAIPAKPQASQRRAASPEFDQTGYPRIDAASKIIFRLGLPTGILVVLMYYIVIPMTHSYISNADSIPIKIDRLTDTIADNSKETHALLSKLVKQTAKQIEIANKKNGDSDASDTE